MRPPLPALPLSDAALERALSAMPDADLSELARIIAARMDDSGLRNTVAVLRETAKRLGVR